MDPNTGVSGRRPQLAWIKQKRWEWPSLLIWFVICFMLNLCRWSVFEHSVPHLNINFCEFRNDFSPSKLAAFSTSRRSSGSGFSWTAHVDRCTFVCSGPDPKLKKSKPVAATSEPGVISFFYCVWRSYRGSILYGGTLLQPPIYSLAYQYCLSSWQTTAYNAVAERNAWWQLGVWCSCLSCTSGCFGAWSPLCPSTSLWWWVFRSTACFAKLACHDSVLFLAYNFNFDFADRSYLFSGNVR